MKLQPSPISIRRFDRSKMLVLILLAGLMAMPISPAAARGVYMEPKAFIESAFDNSTGTLSVMRLTPEMQEGVKKILGRAYPAKRVRYWKQGTRTAWIMDQIGKTEPITVGVVVDQGQIGDIKILVFRESRGAEVRHSFFTEQFFGAVLQPDFTLSNQVDGITGATLSVVAVKKVARLALYLDKMVDSLQTP